MPVYEYQCMQCNHEFSQFFTSFDTDQKVCPICGETKKLVKKISQPSSIKKNSSEACGSCSSKSCGSCGA